MARPPDGILLVDKPAGVTSHAVVAAVGRRLGVYPPRRGRRFRIGHAGALDPAATGLLVLLLGKATRLAGALLGHDKTYTARIVFGAETDTLDAEGETIRTAPLPDDPDRLAAALSDLAAAREQVPPRYSSLKRDGVALHRRLRAGEAVPEPEPRPVRVRSLALREVARDPDGRIAAVTVRLRVGGGYYVRSLARDLGRRLDSAAHLAALRREAVGELQAADAAPLDALDDAAAIRARIRPAADALPELPRLVLTPGEAEPVRHGAPPPPAWLDRLPAPPAPAAGTGEGRFLLATADGTLLALAVVPLGEGGRPAGPPRLRTVLDGLRPPAGSGEGTA